MTSAAESPSGRDAARGIVAHLLRVDLQLARAGLRRSERDAICRQVIEQFHDLLPVPVEQATARQVEAALGELSSEISFASDEIVSRGQLLRMLWHRFWIGTPLPLAFNEHGRKRILWRELIKRMGCLYLCILLLCLVTNIIIVGDLTLPALFQPALFAVMLPIAFGIMVARWPVSSLPRAEHWPIERLQGDRFTATITIVGSFLFLFALLVGVYWTSAILSHRPPWPVNGDLFFLAAVMPLGALGLLISLGEMWRKRRRRDQLQQWAIGRA